MPAGTSVGGPQTQTSAPSLVSSRTFDRSTRLCSRSPTIATFSPSMRPLCSRMVNASSSACVGCSCMPSPALMMRERQIRASRWQAPDEAWRRTIMSGAIASMFIAVSASVSPLSTLEVDDGDVQRVGAQPLLRDLERRARARARLVEQVDDRLAAQRRHLLDRPLADLAHRLGGVEDQVDLVAREIARCRAGPSSCFLNLDFVAAVDLRAGAPGRSATARSAGSCRRSRP